MKEVLYGTCHYCGSVYTRRGKNDKFCGLACSDGQRIKRINENWLKSKPKTVNRRNSIYIRPQVRHAELVAMGEL